MSTPIKILLVGEDGKPMDSLRQELKNNGFEVLEAFNGRNAIDLLKTRRFVLAVVGLKVPEIDGFEILEFIKKNRNLLLLNTGIKTLVLTSSGDDKDRMKCKNLDVGDFVLIPYDLWDLMEAIKRVLKS